MPAALRVAAPSLPRRPTSTRQLVGGEDIGNLGMSSGIEATKMVRKWSYHEGIANSVDNSVNDSKFG